MPPHTTGLLPSQEIRALIGAREIRAVQDIDEDQIQPASLDLRLGLGSLAGAEQLPAGAGRERRGPAGGVRHASHRP